MQEGPQHALDSTVEQNECEPCNAPQTKTSTHTSRPCYVHNQNHLSPPPADTPMRNATRLPSILPHVQPENIINGVKICLYCLVMYTARLPVLTLETPSQLYGSEAAIFRESSTLTLCSHSICPKAGRWLSQQAAASTSVREQSCCCMHKHNTRKSIHSSRNRQAPADPIAL